MTRFAGYMCGQLRPGMKWAYVFVCIGGSYSVFKFCHYWVPCLVDLFCSGIPFFTCSRTVRLSLFEICDMCELSNLLTWTLVYFYLVTTLVCISSAEDSICQVSHQQRKNILRLWFVSDINFYINNPG